MGKFLQKPVLKNFDEKYLKLFKSLNSPAKVQDLLNSIPYNFDKEPDTVRSPLYTLLSNKAHCIEGAILGAFILSLFGHKPFVMLLKANKKDLDHVIAPFKINGLWGALSKTNHAVLRYREPVYKNIRELAMSYFHEYTNEKGEKTLRKYSTILNLNIFEDSWPSDDGDLWGIDEELDKVKLFDILPKGLNPKKLRKADEIEIKIGNLLEWEKK